MEQIPIMVPQRAMPSNPEGRDCDCMNREYLLKYKSGTLHWCAAVGQRVRAGETVCEAEIDKKIFEIPAPADGVLAEQCIEEDAAFKCSQVLGYLHG